MASKASDKLIRILKSDDDDFADAWSGVCGRRRELDAGLDDEVGAILEFVRGAGDRKLLDRVGELCGTRPTRLEVTREEWDEACESLDPADRAAIGKAAMRIREFHRKRIPSSWEMREEGGCYMGQRVRPLARVGIVVPYQGGTPSDVIMYTVPPSVVEVPEIFMASEPGPDGKLRPDLLMAARVAGVHRVFKLGGAYAVGALGLGTQLIPQVDRILGSGNAELAVAKHLVSPHVGVDVDLGPSEICVVADKTATPGWIAADLVAEAERDPEAQVVLLTHYKGIIKRVQDAIAKLLKASDCSKIARKALSTRGAIVHTRSLDESLDLANQYAPEHLTLAVDNSELAAKSVVNAGTILLGHYTPAAASDYLAGPNHILPTGGSARYASPLGVEDFLKRTSFIKFEPPKLRELGADMIRLAQVEGLSSHGTSVDLRLQKIRRARREREAAREAEL